MGIPKQAAQGLHCFPGKTQAAGVDDILLPVEEAKHQGFPPDKGHHRETHVHVPAAQGGGEAAVLGLAALHDVQVGHQLDARGNRGETFGRVGSRDAQQTVQAVPDGHTDFIPLHVNVRSAEPYGVQDDAVHQVNRGGIPGNPIQRGSIRGTAAPGGHPPLN